MPERITAWQNCQALGREEGFQIQTKLNSKLADGADTKVHLLKSFCRTIKLLSESIETCRDPLGTQGLLDLRFQRSGFLAGHFDLVKKLPAFACVRFEPVCPNVHDAVLDLAGAVDQVDEAFFCLVVTAFVTAWAATASDAIFPRLWPFITTNGTFPVKHNVGACGIFG